MPPAYDTAVNRAAQEDLARLVATPLKRTDPHSPSRDFWVCWCSPGVVDHVALEWGLGMANHDIASGKLNYKGFTGLVGGPRVHESRSQLVDQFLHHPALKYNGEDHDDPRKGVPWLVMFDSDMNPEPDAAHRLIERADAEGIKVIGGLCFTGSAVPTVYRLDADGDSFTVKPELDYPRDALVKVGATGAAFIAMHRDVLVAMGVAFGKRKDGTVNHFPWFEEGQSGGRQFGEDITFCLRAAAVGFPVYVDTSVKVGHMKRHEITEETFDATRR